MFFTHNREISWCIHTHTHAYIRTAAPQVNPWQLKEMQHLIAAWTICARISKDGSGWRSNKRGKTSAISNLGYLCDAVFMCINHIWSHLEPFWQKRWVIKIWQDLRSLLSLVCFADLKAFPQKKAHLTVMHRNRCTPKAHSPVLFTSNYARHSPAALQWY